MSGVVLSIALSTAAIAWMAIAVFEAVRLRRARLNLERARGLHQDAVAVLGRSRADGLYLNGRLALALPVDPPEGTQLVLTWERDAAGALRPQPLDANGHAP